MIETTLEFNHEVLVLCFLCDSSSTCQRFYIVVTPDDEVDVIKFIKQHQEQYFKLDLD